MDEFEWSGLSVKWDLCRTKANPCWKFEHVHPHAGLVTPKVHNAADHMLLITTLDVMCTDYMKSTFHANNQHKHPRIESVKS